MEALALASLGRADRGDSSVDASTPSVKHMPRYHRSMRAYADALLD